MLPSHETVPLRHVPIATIVDNIEVHGEIDRLYTNDMTVIMLRPFSGYRTHLHVPYFAMGHAALAISWNLNVVALTERGRRRAEWLLAEAYRHASGRGSSWPVEPIMTKPAALDRGLSSGEE